MNSDEIEIRRPTAKFVAKESVPVFNVDKHIKGLRVGIRNDVWWRSWLQVSDVWSELLVKDGAEPVILRVGEHSGDEGQLTKELIDVWASSVDCAIVGLAN